jgi:acetyl-CoA synthetase
VNATGAYRRSRDQLLHLRGQHDRAVAEFRWPELGPRFNWAVDWFDVIADGNDHPALVVVEEDGSATERTSPRCPVPPIACRRGWRPEACARDTRCC